MSRRLVLAAIAVVAAPFAAALVLLGRTAGGQEARLAKAVPGFSCDALRIETYSARRTWTGSYEIASSVLHMPSDCRARGERSVANGAFTEQACGIGQRCWRRRIDGEQYFIRFSQGSVAFSFSR